MTLINSNIRRNERALTVTELVVALAIMGILASLLIPIFGQMGKSNRAAVCLSQMRQIGVALILYSNDNDSRLPGPLWRGQSPYSSANLEGAFDTTDGNLASFLAPYLDSSAPSPGHSSLVEVFSCPAWLAGSENAGKVICYYSTGSIELPDGAVEFPFGKIAGPGEEESTQPMRLAALTSPATTPAIGEFDRLATSDASFYGKDVRVPEQPVHQSIRQVLFFDAHVASVPVR